MVVVRIDGTVERRQQKGVVSACPTDNDVWGVEIRIGMCLVNGDFSGARYQHSVLLDLRKACEGGRPIQTTKPRRFSQDDIDALKVARAWIDGRGDAAKYLAQQFVSRKSRR